MLKYYNLDNIAEDFVMNKQDVYDYLDKSKIPYSKVEHQAVFTCEEADNLNLPYPESWTKNLFLKDGYGRYYLLTVQDSKVVNLKELQEELQTKRLHFASEDNLMDIMGLIKGSVTLFGILNDNGIRVNVLIDEAFKNKLISCHPNENTATVFLNTNDIFEIIHEHGNNVRYITIG